MMKTRNWHITQLAPDHYLCSYERGKDEHGPSNRVKSIQLITKPDSDGCIFVKTDDLPIQHGTYYDYLNSWTDSNGQEVWKESLSPFLYAAWSGDINIVKLMIKYLPDYYKDEAATTLARLIEVGTDQGPLMQPYLDLSNKSKQLAAQFKWNCRLTMEQRLSALKELGEAQRKLPLLGKFLLCDPAFYKPDYTYLEDNKRNSLIDDIPINTDELGSNSIIYRRRYQDHGPTLGSLKSADRFPMFDGEQALYMAEALIKYYKKVKLELSRLILSCKKEHEPDLVDPIDGLVGFSSDIRDRGISLFYPKHALEEDRSATANNQRGFNATK